ncbi:MAG TPA: regulatory protein RecX [Desulfobacteria bacterium]|nr:regulatory protein RecX [Desulfobacteria bacterium]
MNSSKSLGEQFNSAKNHALKYLSFRPRTVKEIATKLKDKGFDTEVISAVIEFLMEYKLVDDDAFASMWIRNRTKLKPTGRQRIKNELFQKGIDKETIERNISELLPEDEERMAALLIEKKIRRAEFSYKRLEGFLLRRGFSTGIVKRVLSSYSEEN